MPQIGNKKFPYTPSGIKRAAAIKKQLMGGSMKRPTLSMPRPKPPARPGMGNQRLPKPPNRRRAM